MTNLEQLVPPFELCRKIPANAFNDTALVWKKYHRGIISDNPYVAERDIFDYEFREDPDQPIIPAPTAQEILEEMPNYTLTKDNPEADNKFSSKCANGIGGVTRKKLPEMLLYAWLMFKGIKPDE